MCEYCNNYDKNIEVFVGKDFKLNKTTGYKDEYIKYRSWIMKGASDKKAGIMITEYGGNGVFFDIDYCPICGRKLTK